LLANLCQRFYARQLFKTYELFGEQRVGRVAPARQGDPQRGVVEPQVLAQRGAAVHGDLTNGAWRRAEPSAVLRQVPNPLQNSREHPLAGPLRLVEIHLLKHEQARKQERLDGGNALGTIDSERRRRPIGGHAETQAPQEPVEIERAVADAGGVSVAQQVITTVDVERAAHGLGQERELVLALHEVRDAFRQARVEALQDAVHVRARIQHDFGGPGFVASRLRQHLFEQV
jgi:hypothetical protein